MFHITVVGFSVINDSVFNNGIVVGCFVRDDINNKLVFKEHVRGEWKWKTQNFARLGSVNSGGRKLSKLTGSTTETSIINVHAQRARMSVIPAYMVRTDS